MIHWNDEVYSVGIRKMDEQHKQLIGLINALYQQKSSPNRELTDRVLTTLVHYTKRHFVDEEKILKKLNYPKFDAHHDQHLKFIHQVNLASARLEKEGATKELVEGLSKWLAEWLQHHILVEDKAYGAFLEA